VRVVVLTTSYPRHPGDPAGNFVGDAVRELRTHGVAVDVVSPDRFRHFGIAYGAGVVGNLKAHPAKTLLVPPMLASFTRAARRAARDADLVHAHWLPSGAVAALTGKPFVVQLWGTDVELARRAPRLARRILRRARIVICPSTALAEAARELGAREVRVIPSGIELPAEVGQEDEPPHVLYAGRLSPEKGILDLVAAADGLALEVVGDGPLRDQVPQAIGFLPNEELQGRFARAAVVAVPSHREGFGVVCLEAMSHARPVVASAVGGLRDLVVDGETGYLVQPGDRAALRESLERLLADRELRERLGRAARERAATHFSWPRVTELTLQAYADARVV
jgi:colanic acid/amylovoran biosynthesis glycosyltransferase